MTSMALQLFKKDKTVKAVTEFPAFTLNKALQIKTTLAAEGKSADEIKENLGQNFKLEGEKLGYFIQSLEVATTHKENLKRILVVKLNEGEKAPVKAVQVEEMTYVPEFLILPGALHKAPTDHKGGRGGRPGGRGAGGPKSSPWGLSPEEKAAKNKKPAPQA
jgi:hypothetical protein